MKLLVEKGIVTEADVRLAHVSKISFTHDMNDEGVKNAQMVVECVLEEMEMKQNLFAQLEEYVADDCIFCTNTSVMSPTEISAKCKHRERLCGTHFWNPAFLIPLVEVVANFCFYVYWEYIIYSNLCIIKSCKDLCDCASHHSAAAY